MRQSTSSRKNYTKTFHSTELPEKRVWESKPCSGIFQPKRLLPGQHDPFPGKSRQIEELPPGQSLEESVLQLLSYYESHGATIINYLNQVATNPAFAPITQAGGEAHARWIKVLFSSYFKFGNDNNPILQKQIEVILDIRVWELLRYRKGLSVEEVSRVITGLLKPFCDFPKATGDGSSFPA